MFASTSWLYFLSRFFKDNLRMLDTARRIEMSQISFLRKESHLEGDVVQFMIMVGAILRYTYN